MNKINVEKISRVRKDFKITNNMICRGNNDILSVYKLRVEFKTECENPKIFY